MDQEHIHCSSAVPELGLGLVADLDSGVDLAAEVDLELELDLASKVGDLALEVAFEAGLASEVDRASEEDPDLEQLELGNLETEVDLGSELDLEPVVDLRCKKDLDFEVGPTDNRDIVVGSSVALAGLGLHLVCSFVVQLVLKER